MSMVPVGLLLINPHSLSMTVLTARQELSYSTGIKLGKVDRFKKLQILLLLGKSLGIPYFYLLDCLFQLPNCSPFNHFSYRQCSI